MHVSRRSSSLTSPRVEIRASPSPSQCPAGRSPSWLCTLTQRGNRTCHHCYFEGWKPLWPGGRRLQQGEEGQAGLGPPHPQVDLGPGLTVTIRQVLGLHEVRFQHLKAHEHLG